MLPDHNSGLWIGLTLGDCVLMEHVVIDDAN